MPLFGNRGDEKKRSEQIDDEPQDATLKEALSELVAGGKRKEVDRALTEAEQAVDEATRADIRGLKMLERGRCPDCSGRLENYLYTTVCPACGWFRRRVPDTGRCTVYLESGRELQCDRVFEVRGDQVLCVTEGVVRAQVNRRFVRSIDYQWGEEELREARDLALKERQGICSWCESSLMEIEDSEREEGAPFDEYVAFGAYQEHYVFCSRKCLESFRKQFPSRVHRNCYETECGHCDKCIKRYDTDGYRRVMLT
jgi:hypothetical protein